MLEGDESLNVFLPRSSRIMVVSDLDHTMVENEDQSHKRLLAFNKFWMTTFETDGGLLIYSTGRSPELFLKLWSETPLLTPSILVCSVGTEIYYLDPATSTYRLDKAWEDKLDVGGTWDREKLSQLLATFPEIQLQPACEQRRHKLSYHMLSGSASDRQQAVERITHALESSKLPAKVVFSGGQDLDILSQNAGKGMAIEFLLQALRSAGIWPELGVLACGDSANDLEMLAVPNVLGCVVSNAHQELRQWAAENKGPKVFQATEPCASAIMEALGSGYCYHFSNSTLPAALRSDYHRDLPAQRAAAAAVALAQRALGNDVSGAVCWPDMLSASSCGDGGWVVTFMAYRLAPDGKRDCAAARECYALLDSDFQTREFKTAIPKAKAPAFAF